MSKIAYAASFALVMILCGTGILLRPEDAPNLSRRMSRPSFAHWFGNDQLGRDVLARTLRATTTAAQVALPAWLACTVLGTMIGAAAAQRNNTLRSKIIGVGINVVFCTPFLLILVAVGAILGRGNSVLFSVVLLVGWAAPARLARTLVRDALGAPFTQAARSFGFTSAQVFRFALAPACIRPVVAASGAILAEIMVLDAALTLFGFGPTPPTPTLGSLLSDGIRFVALAPWMAAAPLIVICILCLCFRRLLDRSPFF